LRTKSNIPKPCISIIHQQGTFVKAGFLQEDSDGYSKAKADIYTRRILRVQNNFGNSLKAVNPMSSRRVNFTYAWPVTRPQGRDMHSGE
jgi:hypothetical protein